jgi:nitrogen fixation NifU-like protein
MSDKNAKEETAGYPKKILKLLNDQKYFGRMNDPSGSSYFRGPCGDIIEFYLIVEDGRIADINYYTEGCSATKACAAMAAYLASGKTVKKALLISAGEVTKRLKGLPEDHLHCSMLSVSSLYRAIADYLLKL